MVISVTISQTSRQNSVVLLFGTPKETKIYLIIGITGMEVTQVSGTWGKKGAFCTAHL